MWSRSCGGTPPRRSTWMMWRRFDALPGGHFDVLVPFKVVLDNQAQDFVGLNSL